MSALIEKAMASLPLDQRALVDLIIVKSKSGEQARIPRWLITRYPVILSASKSGKLDLILPLHSKSKINGEGLPLASFAMNDVVEIELASYRQSYGAFFLKRQTDPVAVRGQKIFIENCTSCHSAGVTNGTKAQDLTVEDLSLDGGARKLASSGHPRVKDFPKLKQRDLQALISYLKAYQKENSAASSTHSSFLETLPGFTSGKSTASASK